MQNIHTIQAARLELVHGLVQQHSAANPHNLASEACAHMQAQGPTCLELVHGLVQQRVGLGVLPHHLVEGRVEAVLAHLRVKGHTFNQLSQSNKSAAEQQQQHHHHHQTQFAAATPRLRGVWQQPAGAAAATVCITASESSSKVGRTSWHSSGLSGSMPQCSFSSSTNCKQRGQVVAVCEF